MADDKPKPPAPVRPIVRARVTVHKLWPTPCHVHVYAPNLLIRGWTVRCDCGGMPSFFSRAKRAYRTEQEAVDAGRLHLAGRGYED